VLDLDVRTMMRKIVVSMLKMNSKTAWTRIFAFWLEGVKNLESGKRKKSKDREEKQKEL
jgi:hypothetical protein